MPSVGSPACPGLMPRQSLDRNMEEEGEVTRAKETVKEKGGGGQNIHLDMLSHKEVDTTFRSTFSGI